MEAAASPGPYTLLGPLAREALMADRGWNPSVDGNMGRCSPWFVPESDRALGWTL